TRFPGVLSIESEVFVVSSLTILGRHLKIRKPSSNKVCHSQPSGLPIEGVPAIRKEAREKIVLGICGSSAESHLVVSANPAHIVIDGKRSDIHETRSKAAIHRRPTRDSNRKALRNVTELLDSDIRRGKIFSRQTGRGRSIRGETERVDYVGTQQIRV